MIADILYHEVEKKGPICVGLDTDVSYIPKNFMEKFNTIEESIFRFNQKIIDATSDIAACFKVQIAYYEACGLNGLMAYKKTLEYLRSLKLITIADIKRGDIAKTAEMYAKAHFEGDFESDYITVNPYMGLDSLTPYLKYVKENQKGLFALIRTSNPGAEDIQYIEDRKGIRVYQHVGEKLQKLGLDFMGSCGYSSIGGVIGCTHIEEGLDLRKKLNHTFFLIPGYGAQGGGAKEAAVYLRNGNGGVVNSSRAVLLAYKKVEGGENEFDICARNEVIKMREEIQNELSI